MDQIKIGSRMTRSRWGSRGTASCAFAVVIAALCGCGSTTAGTTGAQSTSSNPAPRTAPAPVALHLDAGSYSLSAPSTTISGTVTRGASVVVNGHNMPVHSGRWRETLALHLGRNGVTAAATMVGRAAATQSITLTRNPSTGELEAKAAAIALKAEARKRQLAEAEERKAAKRQQEAETSKTAEAPSTCSNGTYMNSAGNTVCRPEHSPTVPAGATAQCVDGTYSFSESRSGTCSHHGGVATWLGG
jgi:resuscitation-promoting factor RpfB